MYSMMRRTLTKRPMVLCSVRLPAKDKELWQAAAAQEEESQSQFLREAIVDRARRVLLTDKGKNQTLVGHTRNYVQVVVEMPEKYLGEWIKVKIVAENKYYLRGTLLNNSCREGEHGRNFQGV